MSDYAKTAVAFAAGLGLVVVGFVLGDDTLKQIGYGALAVSPLVYVVPNGKQGRIQHGDDGYGLIELLFAVILLVLFIWLLFALVGSAH